MAGINFKAFDLGGHEIARRVWKDYYAKVTIETVYIILTLPCLLVKLTTLTSWLTHCNSKQQQS